jgi:NAD(P)-dependent dehydrogenase (short-subunit alcohol dehydrogenase family)
MSLQKIFSLVNSYVLITGANGLLGQKHAEAIAIAGGTPILTDLNMDNLSYLIEKIETNYNITSLSYKMDVTSEESVNEVLSNLKKQNISIDVLINNAARNPAVTKDGVQSSSRLENLNFNSWEQDIAVGLTGAVICSKVFGTEMARNSKGNIINISSDLGIIAPDQRLYKKDGIDDKYQDVKPVSYSVVKHGLLGLTKYLSTYWTDKNIRCNAISPGGVFNGQNEVFLSKIQERIPMNRMADVDEYMGAIIFLSSNASSYMNGANLIIDGGRSVW